MEFHREQRGDRGIKRGRENQINREEIGVVELQKIEAVDERKGGQEKKGGTTAQKV